MNRLVIFVLDEQRYGLPLSCVDRIVRMVEITSLPEGPEIVLGVIDVQGTIVPVINLRRRFCLPEREIVPADQLIVARTRRRPVALVADDVIGVLECSAEEFVGAREVLPGIAHIDAMVKLDDGLVLIQDLEKFLSLDEASALDQAMAREAAHDV